MNDLLQVSNLTKTYGSPEGATTAHALKDLSFTLGAGQFVSVMGPSGSGKTTLLNVLSGLDTPTSGDVFIDGKRFTGLTSEDLATFRRIRLGFVFQDYNLLDTLTLAENVALPLLLEDRADHDRVHQVMELFGIDDLGGRFPYEVSGGQQQRTAVARAIVHEPAIILADEPTGNLDSVSSRHLLEHFVLLNQQLSASILMVTHDPVAASYAQRVIFIKDGELFTEVRKESHDPGVFVEQILTTFRELEREVGHASA